MRMKGEQTMELNREKIIKALECCVVNSNCNGCPFWEGYVTHRNCLQTACKNALSLIKELTEENERLRAENDKYEAENHAEFNKWLKLEEATKRHHAELFEEAKIAVKEETVRKMQERIAEHATNGYPRKVRLDVIDQIAKEMVEEMR
jgi:hypothetical protein